ncbi:MAG: glucosamine-6-phosphate deaminase [Vicinamibacteria bacterium]
MKLRVVDGAPELALEAADVLAAAVAERPELTLALPTGRTPVPWYAELARRHAGGALDLSRARAFNLDELVLPASDPRTFSSFMRQHAWQRIGLRRERCEIPNGTAADLDAECRRYEAAIAEAGGLDLAVLGIGADGHIAYNMPGPFVAQTHVVRLPDGLASSLGVPEADRPLRAVTMGLGTIRAARRLLLLATGASKLEALRALRRGAQDPKWPCTFLAGHAAFEVLADREAAAGLD